MTLPQVLKAINAPNGMVLSTNELAEFALATIKRLADTCQYYEAKNRSMSIE